MWHAIRGEETLITVLESIEEKRRERKKEAEDSCHIKKGQYM